MVTKVLCVAEKPSIARAVANHLSGNQVTTVRMLMERYKWTTLLMLILHSAAYKAVSLPKTTASPTTSRNGALAMSP